MDNGNFARAAERQKDPEKGEASGLNIRSNSEASSTASRVELPVADRGLKNRVVTKSFGAACPEVSSVETVRVARPVAESKAQPAESTAAPFPISGQLPADGFGPSALALGPPLEPLPARAACPGTPAALGCPHEHLSAACAAHQPLGLCIMHTPPTIFQHARMTVSRARTCFFLGVQACTTGWVSSLTRWAALA